MPRPINTDIVREAGFSFTDRVVVVALTQDHHLEFKLKGKQERWALSLRELFTHVRRASRPFIKSTDATLPAALAGKKAPKPVRAAAAGGQCSGCGTPATIGIWLSNAQTELVFCASCGEKAAKLLVNR